MEEDRRTTVGAILNVVLRVPFVFLIDLAWSSFEAGSLASEELEAEENVSLEYNSHLLRWAGSVFGLFALFQEVSVLISLYACVIELGCLLGVIYCLLQYATSEELWNSLGQILWNTPLSLPLVASVGGSLVPILNSDRPKKRWAGGLLCVVLLMKFLSTTAEVMTFLMTLSFLLIGCVLSLIIFKYFVRFCGILLEGFYCSKNVIDSYGWVAFLLHHWYESCLPTVLALFWWSLLICNFVVLKQLPWEYFFIPLGKSCNSIITLIALSLAMRELSGLFLKLVRICLEGTFRGIQRDFEERGWNEALSLFVLGLQTGVVEMEEDQRGILISLILFIVFSLLLQSMFELTEPVLVSLGASHLSDFWRHARVLGLAFIQFLLAGIMAYSLCTVFDLDVWLFIIISSCIVTAVQVLCAFMVYGLFMIDSMSGSTWDQLDDYVYYVNAFCKTFEFLVAVVVVSYGGWATVTGEWNTIGVVVIALHAYVNVWKKAQEGWKGFLLRRSAVHRLNALPEATKEQLDQHSDVCAICFDELRTARITPCSHFFHGVCLRKWLYIQTKCPMCQGDLISRD